MKFDGELESVLQDTTHMSDGAWVRELHHNRSSWKTRLQDMIDTKKTSTIASHLVVFGITSLLWMSYFSLLTSRPSWLSTSPKYSKHNSTLVPGANFYHCGTTAESAKARGCKYDILNNNWVPEVCIDQAAIEEYQSDESWYGYADANHTELLSIETMGETPVYYTNERDHIVHCAMLWRKQFRALFKGRKYLDSLLIDEKHTMHCSEYLINMTEWGPDFRKKPIQVFVGYAGCHVRE